MGLAASQARLLLLTAKNDALELQAQNVEQQRLLLAQEQETIAQEYSDKTTNTIYTTRVTENGETQQQTTTLASLAKSQPGVTFIIADANGNVIASATANGETDIGDTITGAYDMEYRIMTGKSLTEVDETNPIIRELTANSAENALQTMLANGSLQLWVQDTSADANTKSLSHIVNESGVIESVEGDQVVGESKFYVRKSLETLSTTASRYYTEDDAAAQAAYNTAMAKVNTLDTRLENKLNQIETQKKAVEQEMESVDSIIQSNIERTFQYFS